MNSRLLSVQFFISFLVLSFGVNAMDSLDDMGSRLTSKKRGLTEYKKELASIGLNTSSGTLILQILLLNAIKSGQGIEICSSNKQLVQCDNLLDDTTNFGCATHLATLKASFDLLRDESTDADNAIRTQVCSNDPACYHARKSYLYAIQPFQHSTVRLSTDVLRLNDFIKQKDLDVDENRFGGTPHAQSLFQSIRTNRSSLINAIDKAEDARAIVEAFKKPLALTWQQKVQLRWLKFRNNR